MLRRCLARAATIAPDARPGLLALRALVLPRQDEIAAQIERLTALQMRVRAAPGTFVLCHEDLGGSNLIVDAAGRLFVLDWDWGQYAPAEFDLWPCLGEGLARSLTVYRAAGGVWPLSLDRFAFYLLRRSLQDLIARFERLLTLADDEGTVQDAELLRGMQAFGFDRWCALDRVLVQTDAALATIGD